MDLRYTRSVPYSALCADPLLRYVRKSFMRYTRRSFLASFTHIVVLRTVRKLVSASNEGAL